VAFPGARQLATITGQSTHKKTGQTTALTRHFITSHTARSVTVGRLAETIRGHWSVENQNHRRRDVWWGEDRCRLRRPNAACALALLRTALLALVIPTRRPMPALFTTVIARSTYGLHLLNSK
jgi:predicted transposase YbfD/YdcC